MTVIERLGSLWQSETSVVKARVALSLRAGMTTERWGFESRRRQCLFHCIEGEEGAEGALEESVGGELEPRCSCMALTSAETFGRLLEKLEGPEVEKKRLGGALGASGGGSGRAGI